MSWMYVLIQRLIPLESAAMFEDTPENLAEHIIYEDNLRRMLMTFGKETKRFENHSRSLENEAKKLRRELGKAEVWYTEKCLDNMQLQHGIKRFEDELTMEEHQE